MAEGARRPLVAALETVGRASLDLIEEFGYYLALCVECIYWLAWGTLRRQPVRISATVQQMVEVGLAGLPIIFMLSFAIGVMLAIQGIHTLKQFGAQTQVVLGIALSVTREFGPLMTGIVVAGRSGSSLAARIGTMNINQEIDALRVMGINPVRYLVAPVMVAMLIMMPLMALFADFAALFGGALFCNLELGLSYRAFWDQSVDFLAVDDIMQGLAKSGVFALVVALVGVSNGFSVVGGAEGLGRATTRAVVLSISYIVLADMLFTYFLNRG
ncbi:MAG: ABC transporter permease [Proteobacteria bacterium]|jgi:phospholipid/cholesterol/gamma-HCH transport system permease protein|nr:ABC transporter permease [Pseudomonadota bacterium]